MAVTFSYLFWPSKRSSARPENCKLPTELKRKGFADLSLEEDPTGSDFIELFALKQHADSQFYCNRKDNSAFW